MNPAAAGIPSGPLPAAPARSADEPRPADAERAAPRGERLTAAAAAWAWSVGCSTLGMAVLLGLWWVGGKWVEANPDTSAFADFAPTPTLQSLWRMVRDGSVWEPIAASLQRIGWGMLYAVLIGVPTGVAIGRVKALRQITNMPMQFLRMISPLAWMPIAVMVFDTWEGAIVFLISAAAVWPIVFATSNGVSKIDPAWFTVARNLGALPWQLLVYVILPATAQDMLTGIRLALGVAWVVLVPAEYLGVTSGLGYAINDARDCLEYDRLAAIVLVIGVCGFLIDSVMRFAIARVNWNERR